MLNFKNTIVKTPAQSMVNGITSNPQLGQPDYALAIAQHKNYIDCLGKCGVNVTVMGKDEAFPDSCFVEDAAVIIPNCCAIITNPGADSRNGEIAKMIVTVSKFFNQAEKNLFRITSPGTLDGGDVMMVGNIYYIGLSERTNAAGIEQFREIVKQFDKTVIAVNMDKGLHLKSGVNFLEISPRTNKPLVLLNSDFKGHPLFDNDTFDQIHISDSEKYSANCIWVNNTVIVPQGYPETLSAIQWHGYKTIVCDTSEYRKLDGGLSCLSLRF